MGRRRLGMAPPDHVALPRPGPAPPQASCGGLWAGLHSAPHHLNLQREVYPEPVKVTLFGNLIGRYNQLKMKLCQTGVGPNPVTDGLERRKFGARPAGRHPGTSGGRKGVTKPQPGHTEGSSSRQKLGVEPGTEAASEPPDAGEGISLRSRATQRSVLVTYSVVVLGLGSVELEGNFDPMLFISVSLFAPEKCIK